MDKKIIFYSPLNADVPAYKIGGAEAGCKRTLEILKKLGFQIEMISKPTGNNGIRGYMKETVNSLKEIKKKLSVSDASLFYMVGFYEKNIFLEWCILFFVRKAKMKIIYEPKNGCMITDYQKGNFIYRYFQQKVWKWADCIFCQGTKYVHFLKEILNIDGVYIPNFIMDRYLEKMVIRSFSGKTHLIFTGRISPEKNIDLIIRVSKRLFELGIDNDLTLIGAYKDSYKAELDQLMTDLEIKKNFVYFLGQMSSDMLFEKLKEADFFIFPSTNRTEGHSNALTEAMAFGVIPIASTAGFNREIIGNDELIMDELKVECYAECIVNILKSGQIEELRQEMMQRVKQFYTESIVTKRIADALEELLTES